MRIICLAIVSLLAISHLIICRLAAVMDVAVDHPRGVLASHTAAATPCSSLVKRSPVLADYRERHRAALGTFIPLQAAAADLETVLHTIRGLAGDRWAVHMPARRILELGRGHISLLFASSNEKVPVPWDFIMHLSDYLLSEVSKGFTGNYQAQWTHKVTDVVITVLMRRIEDS